MTYSDGIHIVSDTLEELHEFAKKFGVKRCWFHGVKKGHPHYDCPKGLKAMVIDNVALMPSRVILRLSKEMIKQSKSNEITKYLK